MKLVAVRENSTTLLWPYTSRRPSFDTATLPINVVVTGDPSFVRFLLTATPDATWNVTDQSSTDGGTKRSVGNESAAQPESGVVLNGTAIEWTTAPGSIRYTFVYDEATEAGRWMEETYQLHDGDYLGTRYHVRLYGGSSRGSAWTAIQAHREHWDWFRLRHTVDSVGEAQSYVEKEFYEAWFTRDVHRDRFANGSALDSDGWVTVIELTDGVFSVLLPPIIGGITAAAALLMSARPPARALKKGRRLARRQSSSSRYLVLFVMLAVLILGIRVGSIWIEQAVPTLTPKAIAAVFYPLLVIGTPAIAVLASRDLEPTLCGFTAMIGFGTGVLADYVYLHVTVLPIQVIVHRGMLVVVIGALAAAGSLRTGEDPIDVRMVGLGVLAWFVVLVLPLINIV